MAVEEAFLAGGGGGLFGRRWRRPFWLAEEEAFLGRIFRWWIVAQLLLSAVCCSVWGKQQLTLKKK